jgi:hypothetical protein
MRVADETHMWAHLSYLVDLLSLASSEPRFASANIIPWEKILIAHLK